MTSVEITKIPGFISDTECELLVDAFENNALTNSKNDFWDDMIVYPGKITDSDVLGLMAETGSRTREVILDVYKPKEIFSDSIMLCRWDVGKELTPHIDNQDTHQYSTPWRTYSSLVYLNDDFAGGETNFPRIGLSHLGAKGDAVLFRNVDATGAPDHDTMHAGMPPTSGEKWVFSQWIREFPRAGE